MLILNIAPEVLSNACSHMRSSRTCATRRGVVVIELEPAPPLSWVRTKRKKNNDVGHAAGVIPCCQWLSQRLRSQRFLLGSRAERSILCSLGAVDRVAVQLQRVLLHVFHQQFHGGRLHQRRVRDLHSGAARLLGDGRGVVHRVSGHGTPCTMDA